jgi:CheY-like chemotaxis protein
LNPWKLIQEELMAQAMKAAMKAEEWKAPQTQPNTHPAKRVLIVEDDLEQLTLIDSMIRSMRPELEIDWAYSSEEAIDLLNYRVRCDEANRYSLIVVDVFLEGRQTGLDLLKYCADALPQVPTVVVSALSPEQFYHAIGDTTIAPAFIPKPVRLGEGQQILSRMLDYADASPGARN